MVYMPAINLLTPTSQSQGDFVVFEYWLRDERGKESKRGEETREEERRGERKGSNKS